MKRIFLVILILACAYLRPVSAALPPVSGDELLGGGPSFTITPNPVSGSYFSLNLDFSYNEYPDAAAEGRVRITVMDANLDKGVYFLQIKSGDATKTQKLAIR
jgi:hypothetical protein